MMARAHKKKWMKNALSSLSLSYSYPINECVCIKHDKYLPSSIHRHVAIILWLMALRWTLRLASCRILLLLFLELRENFVEQFQGFFHLVCSSPAKFIKEEEVNYNWVFNQLSLKIKLNYLNFERHNQKLSKKKKSSSSFSFKREFFVVKVVVKLKHHLQPHSHSRRSDDEISISLSCRFFLSLSLLPEVIIWRALASKLLLLLHSHRTEVEINPRRVLL